MNNILLTDYLKSYRSLSRVVDGLLFSHWKWLASQYWCGLTAWNAVQNNKLFGLAYPGGKGEEAMLRPTDESNSLEARALERINKGLAPPREIYEAQNGARIDWSKVPEWAKATDPELFEGCGHEG